MVKNSFLNINCKGKLLNLSTPVVMGILNVTPDSFYTKGREQTKQDFINLAERMLSEGASILDIGGVSTRPNAEPVSEQEEMDRVMPVLESLHSAFPELILSMDTTNSRVAQYGLEHGASIINDVSGGLDDPDMYKVVASYRAPFICMHRQGTPKTMQVAPHYHHVVKDIHDYFSTTLQQISTHAITDIILDVGFGFGKTMSHNYQLLNHLEVFTSFNRPLLVGISRKAMVQKVIHQDSEHALNGTTALHMVALQKGANILRVHDVKEAMECIQLYSYLQDYGQFSDL